MFFYQKYVEHGLIEWYTYNRLVSILHISVIFLYLTYPICHQTSLMNIFKQWTTSQIRLKNLNGHKFYCIELLYIFTPSSKLSVLEIGAYLKRFICSSIPIFCFDFFPLQTTVSKDITQFGYVITIGLAQ